MGRRKKADKWLWTGLGADKWLWAGLLRGRSPQILEKHKRKAAFKRHFTLTLTAWRIKEQHINTTVSDMHFCYATIL